MEKIIKIVLALLFFACLMKMPYGFYQLVRFVGLFGFIWLAILSNQLGKQSDMFIYIILALLFQPIIKVGLGRQIWNIVDVLVGLYLIISLYGKRHK